MKFKHSVTFDSFLFCFVVDKKIKTLDNELRGFKEQLKKAKGPTAEHIKKRAVDVLKRKVTINVFNILDIFQFHIKFLFFVFSL
jgi:hypothetical protein